MNRTANAGATRIHVGRTSVAAPAVNPAPNASQHPVLAEDPDFRRTMRAYMEWAVDEVLRYGSPDAVVVGGMAMPRWSWDGGPLAEAAAN